MNWEVILGRDPNAKLELVNAYTRLFSGHGDPADAQIVFTDLMTFSGYFSVPPEGISVDRHNGSRSVGARIFTLTNMAEWERVALYQAARRSAFVDQEQGEL